MNFPNFEGKCLSITIMNDSVNHDLLNPYFEEQAGRIFLIGTVPVGATDSDWVAGCKGAVAWDRVTEYHVFNSLDDYSKAIKISEEYQ